MIRIDELTEQDIGAGVVYVPQHGRRENGVITSWNERYIFVRYGRTGSQATRPEDLERVRARSRRSGGTERER